MRGLQAWNALSSRDRFLLKGLAVFLIGVLLLQTLWLPGRERLANAERYHQQQLLLAQQVQRAQPQRTGPAAVQPSASSINDSAEASGLDVTQVEVQNERLRLSLNGEAEALLNWLAVLERDVDTFEVLTLVKRADRLEAHIEL
ncbi:type II secretion system protein GspM [Pseudomonas carnis]|nr:type II secretion system protein GspM [Pseudomonas carnis]